MRSLTIKLKEKIKRSFLGDNIRLLARPYFWYKRQKSTLEAWNRKRDLLTSAKYEWIKDIKDTHNYERCFIVATGPSLTFEDLDLIKNEFSIAMNSCISVFDKTEWRPSLYGIQDEFVYEKVEKDILKEADNGLEDKIIVANIVANIFPSAKRFKLFPLHYLNHKYNPKKTGELRFSDNCYATIYDGYSIIFSLMQLAVYMGFKEIYILGCDCNYNQQKQHFVEHGTKDPNRGILGNRLIYTHSLFDKFAKAHGVQVYNCTRGGMLEVYPRKRLEDVVKC